MVKKNLEERIRKAVLKIEKIEKKVSGIYDVLCDLSLKLCHIIESKRDYYGHSEANGYYK